MSRVVISTFVYKAERDQIDLDATHRKYSHPSESAP